MDCQHWIACSTVMFSSSFTLDLIRHTQREERKKVAIKNGGRLVSFIISTLGQPGSEVGSFFAHPIPPPIGPTISWIRIWVFILPFHDIFSWILMHATEQLCCPGQNIQKTVVFYHLNFSILCSPHTTFHRANHLPIFSDVFFHYFWCKLSALPCWHQKY